VHVLVCRLSDLVKCTLYIQDVSDEILEKLRHVLCSMAFLSTIVPFLR